MTRKTVLVLEDRAVLRTTVADGLTKRGFNVIAASAEDEAWRLLTERDDPDVDVALLDINLGDGSAESGLDFGMKLKQVRGHWPPEFLIYSAFDDPDYYQTAMTLGAAGYLRKGVYGGDLTDPGAKHLPRVEVLAQHVRALALRRGLRGDRPGMAERVEEIAAMSRSREEAVGRFCRQILAAELSATFGDLFVLLLSYDDMTTCFFSVAEESISCRAFGRIQDVVHSRLGDVGPMVIDFARSDWLNDVPPAEHEPMAKFLERANEAAFIALGGAKAFRLSLGILASPYASAIDQAVILERYVQQIVPRSLLDLMEVMSALERQRSQLTVDFCFYQGQELANLIWDAEKGGGAEMAALRKVRVLAEELRDAGELLMYFASPAPPPDASQMRPVEVSELVAKIWTEEVSPPLSITGDSFLQVQGHCVVVDRIPRADRIISQILTWMARRIARLEPVDRESLFVRCSTSETTARSQIVFEELITRRIPPPLRDTLFKPFYTAAAADPLDETPDKERRLGLYLAYTLAELGGGSLVDCSDEIEGSRGHRFVLELPAAPA